MAKRDFAVTTCPICLDVDEEESMVAVPIQRTNPPDSRKVLFCRRCVRAIVRAAAELEAAPSTEGENDASTSARDSRGSASVAPDVEAPDPLVLQNQPGGESSGVDRGEPRADAGGQGASSANESVGKARRVKESTVVEK